MLLPPIKTFIYSSIYNHKGTCSTITPLTLSPITSTLGGTTAATASIKYIRVYSAIAISIYINIVYKRVTNIAKNI